VSFLVAQLALALLAAAAPPERLLLMDDTFEVPAADWRSLDLELRQRPAVIDCRFAVRHGGSGVRVALLRLEDLDRLRAGKSHRVLASSSFEQGGKLHVAVPPGRYSLLLDNRLEGRGPAQVWVQASLVFATGPPIAAVLSPQRRAVVVALSLIFFIAVALFAGRKLKQALKQRREAQPPFWV
jgi:hypothetical protein